MFTSLVKRSILPILLIIAGAVMGSGEAIFWVLAIVGGIWEALVVAKILDSRRESDSGPRLPPL